MMKMKFTASPSALPELAELALTLALLVTIGLGLDGFVVNQAAQVIGAAG